MDEKDQRREPLEDLDVPEPESDEVKGGAGGGAWFLRNSNTPAEPVNEIRSNQGWGKWE